MFNLPYSFSILTLLCIFVQLVYTGRRGLCYDRRMHLGKNPHIEECILSSRPKATGTYVTPSFILCVSTPGLKRFSIERLEDCFNTSVVANLSQEVRRDISNLLCHVLGYPPLWQVMAWSTENTEPQQHL